MIKCGNSSDKPTCHEWFSYCFFLSVWFSLSLKKNPQKECKRWCCVAQQLRAFRICVKLNEGNVMTIPQNVVISNWAIPLRRYVPVHILFAEHLFWIVIALTMWHIHAYIHTEQFKSHFIHQQFTFGNNILKNFIYI